jgi:hypothetical protein
MLDALEDRVAAPGIDAHRGFVEDQESRGRCRRPIPMFRRRCIPPE